jgi:hypothetical protein
MKSVKLVYNGDLGRSIEDWVAAQLQRQQQQQQQQTGLAAWRRALSGHLEGHHLPQDGAGAAAAAAEGVAAAAAGMFMHMRGNGGQVASPAAAAAEAASGGEGGEGGMADGDAGDQGGPAAAAAAAGAESGSILSGAGALMRTSSAAIAQVASMVSVGAASTAPAGWLAGWQDCHVHVSRCILWIKPSCGHQRETYVGAWDCGGCIVI